MPSTSTRTLSCFDEPVLPLVDALDRACGVRDIDMPATPHAVFRALAGISL
jgi:hypothetical protein